jgi:hypothetical protein
MNTFLRIGYGLGVCIEIQKRRRSEKAGLTGASLPAVERSSLLIGSDEFVLGEDMSAHRLFQCHLGRPTQVRKDYVQGVELVEVAIDRKSVV